MYIYIGISKYYTLRVRWFQNAGYSRDDAELGVRREDKT